MTVFSTDRTAALHRGRTYTLNLGQGRYTFNEDRLADIRFSQSAPNHGMYGITTGQLECRIYSENAENILQNLTPDTNVSFSELYCPLILSSAHIVSRNVLSITASTKTINAGISFYKNGYPAKGEDGKSIAYSMDDVVKDAFALIDIPYSYSASSGMKLYLSEFEGRSVNAIIEEASKIYGGFYCVKPTGTLSLLKYSDIAGGDGIDGTDGDITSEVCIQSSRKISRVITTDSESGEIHEYGSTSAPWYETAVLDGDYLFGEAACRTAADSMRHEYIAWNCENVVVPQPPSLGALFESYTGRKLAVGSVDVRYTKNHIISAIGASAPSADYADYKNSAERKLEARVKANSVYGGTSIDSKDGLCFVWTDKSAQSKSAMMALDAELTADRLGERYAFTPGKDGVVKFDGAMVDNAKPKIELKSDLSGFSTVYGDTAVEYMLEWDGDNVTLKDLPKEE